MIREPSDELQIAAGVVLADGVGLVDNFAVWSDVAAVLGDVVLGWTGGNIDARYNEVLITSRGLAGDAALKVGEYCPGFRDFVACRAVPVQLCIPLQKVLYPFAGQKYGGVIFIAHKPAYLR